MCALGILHFQEVVADPAARERVAGSGRTKVSHGWHSVTNGLFAVCSNWRQQQRGRSIYFSSGFRNNYGKTSCPMAGLILTVQLRNMLSSRNIYISRFHSVIYLPAWSAAGSTEKFATRTHIIQELVRVSSITKGGEPGCQPRAP